MNKLKIMIFNFMEKIRSCSTNTTLLWTQCKKNRTKKNFVENLHAAYNNWPLIRSTIYVGTPGACRPRAPPVPAICNPGGTSRHRHTPTTQRIRGASVFPCVRHWRSKAPNPAAIPARRGRPPLRDPHPPPSVWRGCGEGGGCLPPCCSHHHPSRVWGGAHWLWWSGLFRGDFSAEFFF